MDLHEAATFKKLLLEISIFITLLTDQSPNNGAWKLKIAFTKDFWGKLTKFSILENCDFISKTDNSIQWLSIFTR